jgi:hypothetical protein
MNPHEAQSMPPAPDNLQSQTPGEPTASAFTGSTVTASTTTTADAPAAPLYVAKHKGAGKWIAVTNNEAATQVGDFVGDKLAVVAEVDRLNAGGEPLVLDPRRENEPKPEAAPATADNIDASTLKQAVMTPEGWLCPEPKAKD